MLGLRHFGLQDVVLCSGVLVNGPSSPRGSGWGAPPLSLSLLPCPHLSFQLTVEMFDYMDCELKLSESGEAPGWRSPVRGLGTCCLFASLTSLLEGTCPRGSLSLPGLGVGGSRCPRNIRERMPGPAGNGLWCPSPK